MAFKELTDNFKEVGEKVQEYGESTLEYQKLRIFKSSMKGATSLVNLLVLGSVFLFILLFLSLGASFIIGNELGKVSYGFFIVGGFYAVVLVLVALFGKRAIERQIILNSSKLFYDDDELKPEKTVKKEHAAFTSTAKNETT